MIMAQVDFWPNGRNAGMDLEFFDNVAFAVGPGRPAAGLASRWGERSVRTPKSNTPAPRSEASHG
jgi:hypothetical protein